MKYPETILQWVEESFKRDEQRKNAEEKADMIPKELLEKIMSYETGEMEQSMENLLDLFCSIKKSRTLLRLQPHYRMVYADLEAAGLLRDSCHDELKEFGIVSDLNV